MFVPVEINIYTNLSMGIDEIRRNNSYLLAIFKQNNSYQPILSYLRQDNTLIGYCDIILLSRSNNYISCKNVSVAFYEFTICLNYIYYNYKKK